MSWKSVIGQPRIKNLLKASLGQGRLAHAYLFVGEEGSGKYTAALELAKTVNCQKSSVEACDACPSCTGMMSLQHPNLHLVFPLPVGKNEEAHDPPLSKLSDAQINAIKGQLKLKAENPYHKIQIERANEIRVNSAREIRRKAAITSFSGGKKVFIILDAQTMNDEASNAFLKTLEEPTPATVFILIAEKPESLLQTIVSRCQVLRFDPLNELEIEEALVDRYQLDRTQAAMAASNANGSFSRALQFVDPEATARREVAINFLRTIIGKQRSEINVLVEELCSDYRRQDFSEMFNILQQWFRDAMLLSEGMDKRFVKTHRESLEKFVNNFPSWDYPAAIEVIERSISLLDKNVYIPLILMNVALNLKRVIGERKI